MVGAHNDDFACCVRGGMLGVCRRHDRNNGLQVGYGHDERGEGIIMNTPTNVLNGLTHDTATNEAKKLLNERRLRSAGPFRGPVCRHPANGFAGLRICLPNNLGAE